MRWTRLIGQGPGFLIFLQQHRSYPEGEHQKHERIKVIERVLTGGEAIVVKSHAQEIPSVMLKTKPFQKCV